MSTSTLQPLGNGTPCAKTEPHPLRNLFRQLTHDSMEMGRAATEARAAMQRLAQYCAQHRFEERTLLLRCFLYSAFNPAGRCTLNDLQLLPWPQRQDFTAVLLAVGTSGFADSEIRAAFITEEMGAWFLEEAALHHV